MKKVSLTILTCILFVGLISNLALSYPHRPPVHGKVWVEVRGVWIEVIAPPGDGPYIWREEKWVIDPTPPPAGSEWIPGHWDSGKWIPGHWEPVSSEKGMVWIAGHWEGEKWIPGHWEGKHPQGKAWVPGHVGPRGHWIPGHWR